MLLICPNCAARYEVDGSKFPAAGRKVRCAKCGTTWHQATPQAEAEPDQAEIEAVVFEGREPESAVPIPESDPEVFQEPEPVRAALSPTREIEREEIVEEASRPSARNGGVVVALGWVALVAVILLIGFSAASFRAQIVDIWPQSASLFARMGMAVNTRGLDFTDIRHLNQTEDGQPVLVITGKLVNVGAQRRDVPPLRVTLSDANRHAIYDWSFEPSRSSLAPGQTVAFRTRLSNPPTAAVHVEIRFADGAE
jgi:predicted Zn finger-like uncharacterized protein